LINETLIRLKPDNQPQQIICVRSFDGEFYLGPKQVKIIRTNIGRDNLSSRLKSIGMIVELADALIALPGGPSTVLKVMTAFEYIYEGFGPLKVALINWSENQVQSLANLVINWPEGDLSTENSRRLVLRSSFTLNDSFPVTEFIIHKNLNNFDEVFSWINIPPES